MLVERNIVWQPKQLLQTYITTTLMADGPHLNPIRDEKYEEDDKDQTIWAKTIHCTSL